MYALDQNMQRQMLAMLPLLIAFLLVWASWDYLQPYVWLLFFPAVFLATWIGGLQAGLIVTFTSAVVVFWAFIPQAYSFSFDAPASVIPLSVFCAIGVLVSVTLGLQHKKLRSLKASEERYRMLFNAMDEGFCVIEMLYDKDGKPVDYRFVEINNTFESQTGLEHALGKTMRELVPEHDESWFEIYGKVALTGVPVRFENPANAMQRHYDVFASRIGGEGSHQVGIIFKDITERKQAERALVAAKEQAELANRAKDSFLATMSHEIRTPLTGMLGMLEVLSLSSMEREQTETLHAAWDSGRSLLRIVSDILDWSKIEEGKLELCPRTTSIPQLVQDVANTYSRVASAKSLMITQHADPRLSQAHIVDPLRLSQVLNNFVSNAIKFTLRGGVELRAELVERLDSGERIRFSVKDTGIGMRKEVQQHLFQRYRQESADTARMYGGTGLGLAICRRLADFMDGKIELKSAPDKGSTFSLTLILPVSGELGAASQSQHPEVEPKAVTPIFDDSANAPLVLAVDDHPINRDLLVLQLGLLGLRVETAENGAMALELWKKNTYRLVITDCHMPEMDGYSLASAIREIEAAESRPHTPVIAWTANALAEESEHCEEAGMDDLLIKPTGLTQLREILVKWLFMDESADHQAGKCPQHAAAINGGIDKAVLSETVPGKSEQTRVLHDFLTYIRVDNLQLMKMFEMGDQLSAERMAHRLKGSSRMVGASRLADIYADIEQTAQGANTLHVDAMMAKANEAVRDLETYLLQASKPEDKV